MNRLSTAERAAIIGALVEGASIRAACRLTGHSKRAVSRLLLDLAEACRRFHNTTVRNLTTRRVQCDEVWSFVGAKERHVRPENVGQHGDLWTWVGLDADSKLAISWHVGARGVEDATVLMRDLVSRLANRVQLTTDGHRPYLTAVESAFGWNGVDYAVLEKIYATASGIPSRDASARVIGTRKTWVMGNPREEDVSTSYVERSNLTLRLGCRRFTRLTNAFSRKQQHHAAAVALHFMHYNFCRVHTTLTKRSGGIHQTPAMAAGLATHVWTVAQIAALLEPALSEAA